MAVDPVFDRIARAICNARSLAFQRDVGSGAFKHTFLVKSKDGVDKALKVYRETGAGARVLREVKAIARCNHPGVARFEYLDSWQDGGQNFAYSIEEFLAGGTLADRLKQGILPSGTLKRVGSSLIDAVDHIASLRLVHRDLKPDNIMFRGPDDPVIVDFGLVRDLDATSLTMTWAMRGPGTPYFSAPEQLLNQKALIDWRADQFGLGVVLAISGTGNHPFALPGLSSQEVVERVAKHEQPAPEFVKWARRESLDPLVRMVSAWPVNRFRTPAELKSAWV